MSNSFHFVAGEQLQKGQAIHRNSSDDLYYSISTLGVRRFRGICLNDVDANDEGVAVKRGQFIFPIKGAFNAGNRIYADPADGFLTATKVGKKVGVVNDDGSDGDYAPVSLDYKEATTDSAAIEDDSGNVTSGVPVLDTAGIGYFFGVTIHPPQANTTAGVGSVDQVRCKQFVLGFGIIVGNIVVEVLTAGAAGKKAGFAIFDSGKNLLLETGAIAADSTGVKTVALGTPVQLDAGVYYLAWTADDASVVLRGNGVLANQAIDDFMNKNANRAGTAANTATSGVMPATLGAITPTEFDCPMVMFEV